MLTDEQTDINYCWKLFNKWLNKGLSWDAARQKCIDVICAAKEKYDEEFEIDPGDPLNSEAQWTKKIDRFNGLLRYLKFI